MEMELPSNALPLVNEPQTGDVDSRGLQFLDREVALRVVRLAEGDGASGSRGFSVE